MNTCSLCKEKRKQTLMDTLLLLVTFKETTAACCLSQESCAYVTMTLHGGSSPRSERKERVKTLHYSRCLTQDSFKFNSALCPRCPVQI